MAATNPTDPAGTLLDGVLAEAAVAAGAEFRDGVRVIDLVEDGGRVGPALLPRARTARGMSNEPAS